MNRRMMMFATALLATVTTIAAAHHSAVPYDFTKQVPIKGTVKEFHPINPHMQLVLVVTDAKGQHELSLEGHSTNNMYRGGYRKGMIKVGDNVTVYLAPLKDGTQGGFVLWVITAGGGSFGRPVSAQLGPSALSGIEDKAPPQK